ncbi:MAG TPA: ABC transporter ATP-binding protein [Anaerolineae bacterium]|nr:ABC transporter ATP-binding protein [Anaerolineae bacterium]
MICVRGLSFKFQDSETHALKDVHLDIEPGEFVVITGPSGCGKSTLALALGGYLFRQHAGEASGVVEVDGHDTREAEIFDVAEIVGLVQQNPEAQLCTLTVADEVAFGLENRRLSKATIQERSEWALEIVGALHLFDRPLATLSGGEKQKIAIAAMMAAKPQVLIFDEPTSNLDPTATGEIFRVIQHIREKAGITVIVIEHKLGYLRPFQPRVVRMEQGRIVSDGRDLPRYSPAESMPAPSQRSTPRSNDGHVVRTEHLTVEYGDSPVLNDLSIDLHAGEFVAVMGDNGSGKTTLLRCLMGLLKPRAGEVVVLGHDTGKTPVSSLARDIGFIFQNPDHQLFAETVWEEAIFAPRNLGLLDEETSQGVDSLLRRCRLERYRNSHPHRLSYGEKRRLNLASILSYEPRVILLDEILIGQDSENATMVMNLLREETLRGSTVVNVTHDPETTFRYSDRVVFLKDGRILLDVATGEALDRLATLGLTDYLPHGRSEELLNR